MKKQICLFFVLFLLLSYPPFFADTPNEYKYYLGELVNAGKDTGYSQTNPIENDDPHFGWEIGNFFLSGYSSVEQDENKNPTILKNVGDKVTLWFCLNEDIGKLNNNEKLFACEDLDGYDNYFGIEKTNFGKGALIIRHKDYENHWQDPVVYTNFLAAQTSVGAYTQVEFFEEGDYEVALNYEIMEQGDGILGWDPFPDYHNYRIFFKFSVRNGNCMVYPFDTKTGNELTNAAFTENGFYLDFANSKYLDVNIKREILNETADGLIEDTRFNRPAKDKEQYTEEGIYTITIRNDYTNQETIKKIYVGTNKILKAHATTGFSVSEINQQISLGAEISDTGELISNVKQNTSSTSENIPSATETESNMIYYFIPVGAFFIIIMIIIGLFFIRKKKHGPKEGAKE
ncbi:MAG: hypothetical protein IJC19_06600 [Clostridia bacterium]|nr:hypothetical protein [Clostridia bacterium]